VFSDGLRRKDVRGDSELAGGTGDVEACRLGEEKHGGEGVLEGNEGYGAADNMMKRYTKSTRVRLERPGKFQE
jgi:hypothetical protein